jgi:hypothetical protein
MKKSTLILLIPAGCASSKIAGVNPTGPPANLFTIAKKGKRTWSR